MPFSARTASRKLLRAIDVALRESGAADHHRHHGLARRVAELGEELTRRAVVLFSFGEALADQLNPALHAQRGRPAEEAAALVCEFHRAQKERGCIGELESRDVRRDEAVGDERLEILPIGLAGGCERGLRPAFRLGIVAEP
jgi:hypothetical protein